MKKCVSRAKPMHSFQRNNHATISGRISRDQNQTCSKQTEGAPKHAFCLFRSEYRHERYNYRPLLSCFSCEMSFNSSDIAQPSSPFALLEPHSPNLWIKRSSMMRGNCSYYSMKIKRGIHFCNIKTINLAIKPIKHYLALKGRKIEKLIGSRAWGERRIKHIKIFF